MFIQIQETPNSKTLKFLPGIEILSNRESISFNTIEDCQASPLATTLMSINEIESVFFGRNFISITKKAHAEWHTLKAVVVATIIDHISSNIPIMHDARESLPHLDIENQEIIKQIVEVINEKVRPAVEEDGGDIKFHSYNNGIVYVEMHGACSGCPNAAITLKSGIENMLQYYVPEVIRVEQI